VGWACTAAGSGNSRSNGNNLVAQAGLKRVPSVFGKVVLATKVSVFMVLLFPLCQSEVLSMMWSRGLIAELWHKLWAALKASAQWFSCFFIRSP
jgi:hypothetical protein